MGTDANDIIEFLRPCETFVSPTEIAKKVGGKRRFSEDRDWARPILLRLLLEGLLESNEYGHFRFKGASRSKKQTGHTNCYYSVGQATYVLDDDQPFALAFAAFRGEKSL